MIRETNVSAFGPVTDPLIEGKENALGDTRNGIYRNIVFFIKVIGDFYKRATFYPSHLVLLVWPEMAMGDFKGCENSTFGYRVSYVHYYELAQNLRANECQTQQNWTEFEVVIIKPCMKGRCRCHGSVHRPPCHRSVPISFASHDDMPSRVLLPNWQVASWQELPNIRCWHISSPEIFIASNSWQSPASGRAEDSSYKHTVKSRTFKECALG